MTRMGKTHDQEIFVCFPFLALIFFKIIVKHGSDIPRICNT